MKKKLAFIIGISGFLFFIQPISAQTWKPAKRLTWNSGTSRYPAIAIDSNNHIHGVWHDITPGNYEIFYKKSTDGGTTWTTKRLTYNSESSQHTAIAADSNDHIHVVWRDYTPGNWEIFYKNSTNGGATWTTKRLTHNSGESYSPAIATDSNNHIHVVWRDTVPGNSEIYYKRSTNGGAAWTTKRLTWNLSSSLDPTIAVDTNDHIHVVWDDSTPGNFEVYYRKSTDGGSSWIKKRLTFNSGYSQYPVIAVDSNNHIHVVWHDYSPGNREIYYKQSTNGGAAWMTTKRLTWNSDDSDSPAITTDTNNHIHVVWWEYTSGNAEIFYNQSTNGGAAWTTKRLTWNLGHSRYPAIAADSNNHIHVTWHDYSPGNGEIYYKKKD